MTTGYIFEDDCSKTVGGVVDEVDCRYDLLVRRPSIILPSIMPIEDVL